MTPSSLPIASRSIRIERGRRNAHGVLMAAGLTCCAALSLAVSACDTFRFDPNLGNSPEARLAKYALRENSAKNARRQGLGGSIVGMDPTANSSGDQSNPAPYVPCDTFADCREKARELVARISWGRADVTVAFRTELRQLRQVAGDAIALNDQDAQVRGYRARAREVLQDWNGAIEDWGVVIAQEPANVDALVRRSHLLFIQDDRARSLADADRALQLAPDRIDALIGRSMIHARNLNFDLALVDADRAVTLDPRNLNALAWRATLHMQRKEKAPALADVGRAIALAPQDAGLYALKGNVHDAFEEPDLARAAYRKACDLGDPLWCSIARQ